MVVARRHLDLIKNGVVLIYKHSRYAYVMDRGSQAEKAKLSQADDDISKELLLAHQKNLECIDQVISVLNNLKIAHSIVCRSDMTKADLQERFIVAIGGDGTLLDCSHYCDESPILGVNSDPQSSIGALCAANGNNFQEVFMEILYGRLSPVPIARLAIAINNVPLNIEATNDLLFCHKNPASMSRFTISLNGKTEAHRSSGMWIATAAGSTGGAYSSGAKPLPLNYVGAIFRMREPYWSDTAAPQLLQGTIKPGDRLTITGNMTDGEIFIDGPHENRAIGLGDNLSVGISEKFLWLFDGTRLNNNRERIIERRKQIRSHLD